MMNQILYSVDFDQVARPFFFYFMIFGGIVYQSYKNKKIWTAPFGFCMMLCMVLLIDILIDTIFKGVLDPLKYVIDGEERILIWGVVELSLLFDIAVYYQCNVLKIFAITWPIRKKECWQNCALAASIILLLIHIVLYCILYWDL